MIQSPAEIARWIRQREELNAKQKELVVRLQNLLSFKKRKGKFDGTNTENLRRVTRPVHLALEMVDGCFQTLWTRLQTTGRLKNLPEQVQSDIHLLKDAFDDMSCCLKLACVYQPDLEKYFNHPYSYCRLLLFVLEGDDTREAIAYESSQTSSNKRQRLSYEEQEATDVTKDPSPLIPRLIDSSNASLPGAHTHGTISLLDFLRSEHLTNPILPSIIASDMIRTLWQKELENHGKANILDSMYKTAMSGSSDWIVGGYCDQWTWLDWLPCDYGQMGSTQAIDLPIQSFPNIWPEVKRCTIKVHPYPTEFVASESPYERRMADAEIFMRVTSSFSLLKDLNENPQGMTHAGLKWD